MEVCFKTTPQGLLLRQHLMSRSQSSASLIVALLWVPLCGSGSFQQESTTDVLKSRSSHPDALDDAMYIIRQLWMARLSYCDVEEPLSLKEVGTIDATQMQHLVHGRLYEIAQAAFDIFMAHTRESNGSAWPGSPSQTKYCPGKLFRQESLGLGRRSPLLGLGLQAGPRRLANNTSCSKERLW